MGDAPPAAATFSAGHPVTSPAEAGPAAPVPVAVLARTSTLYLQDPLSSLRRQFRSAQEWLPPGWYIAAYYWDVESGAIDIEDRSQGTAYEQFTAAGLPRDGGLADLLAEAAAPEPRFAAVVCEDIERSGRDTFNALTRKMGPQRARGSEPWPGWWRGSGGGVRLSGGWAGVPGSAIASGVAGTGAAG